MKKAQASVAAKFVPPPAAVEPPIEKEESRRIEYMHLATIQEAPRNPKLHADEDIQASMSGRGMVEAPTLDERTQRLVAGHGRISALRALQAAGQPAPRGVHVRPDGWWVPVLRGWASRDDGEAEAYLLASNQLTIAGGWDAEPLRAMLSDLAARDTLDALGWSPGELEALLTVHPEGGLADPDDVPPLPSSSWVEAGDYFELGRHRILCGDCTDPEVVNRLMQGGLADICWTDPPWNIDYGEDDNPAGWSKKHQAIANDNLGEAFPGFCQAFAGSIKRALKPGAALYMAMSPQEWPVIHAALTALNFHWSSSIIWTKDSLVLSRKDYHTQYDPIWYGWNGDAARLHPLKDRKQSDVWPIPRPKKSDEHPCLPSGTEVQTETGWRPIEAVRVGDRVLTADGTLGQVEHVSSHPCDGPLVRIAVDGVEEHVDATGNHPFLVVRDGVAAWVEAAQLRVGDEIATPLAHERGTVKPCDGTDTRLVGASPERGTDASAPEGVSEWSTTSSGSEPTGQSPRASGSTTSTRTSRTTRFQTSNLSTPLRTSGFTPVANCETGSGGSLAAPAENSNPSTLLTGTSASSVTPTGGDASRATAHESSPFVLRSVVSVERVPFQGPVWNLSVAGSPTFQTRVGMSHNTMKPVELVARALRNSSKRTATVFEPFSGSGSTIIACEASQRACRAIELEPKYVQVAIERWERFTSRKHVKL